ncbi:hypothetical protein [Sphingomonas sp. Leaf33]|uniref:hypothetical protein n=1 Tax=Sphingomonas sp. Leaf33 TaxID=1736215 RepID=UPI000A4D838B|nr:hypothetical protein [Sphingomonas sp. Leaf33]
MFTIASDGELNELAAGATAGNGVPWTGRQNDFRITPGCTGVLWRQDRNRPRSAKPVALVVHDADRQRLFGRFSQLRGDLSPLSAWCHVLTPQRFEALDSVARPPDLSGFEAAWAGLVVAEAILLAGAPAAKLRTYHCFATQSWAVARTRSLWPRTSVEEICERLYAARRLTRGDETRLARLRQPLQPVWSILAAASDGGPVDPALQPLVAALHALADARDSQDAHEEARVAQAIGSVLPEEARLLRELPSMGAEDRLHLFDLLVDQLAADRAPRVEPRRTALAFVAGYIATVAAGGAASLSLATSHAQDHPQIAAWAYTLGGVGEHVTWTASFDGLGRLIARGLLRPFRIDDQPDCDFALDEGAVLADVALSDPLVHLRIKQGRNLAITIYPGVDVTVPVSEPVAEARPISRPAAVDRSAPPLAVRSTGDELLGSIAELVWAKLEPRLHREIEAVRYSNREGSARSSGTKRSTKTSREPRLPLAKEPR